MVLIERTKEETYTRYRIRPLSDVVIDGERTFYSLAAAEDVAKYWANGTGSYYEIIQEEVHIKSFKVISQDGNEVRE